jgi:5-methylthioadenosine/S-adenosylhomocysteine deaminase
MNSLPGTRQAVPEHGAVTQHQERRQHLLAEQDEKKMNAKARDKIVTAKILMRGFGADGEAQFLAQGAVHVRDGEILAVGREGEIIAAARDCEIERFDEHVMLPGFVNSHHHVGLTPLQMGTVDYPLELWIGSSGSRRALGPYLDTLFSAIEMLKTGVTTVQHIQGAMLGPPSYMRNVAWEVLRAYHDIGMRASFCFNARDQNRLAYEDDDRFVSVLPADLKHFAANYLRQRTVRISDYLTLFDQLRAETVGDKCVKIQLAPANLHWCSDDALLALLEKATWADVPLHMHLLETPYQHRYALRRTGTSAVKHLQRLRLLGPRMTLGHAVWLDQEDVEIIAETGTRVCHNCSSNMRLGSGRAPISTLLDRGVTVAIGIDEAGINDDRDMLQEMRLVMYQNRAPGHDASWPSASEILCMATEGGAKTTGFGEGIGRIASGAHADLLLVNEKTLTYPYQDGNVPLANVLVQRARAQAVDAVFVRGSAVARNGQILTIDEQAVLREIAERLSRDRDESELANLDFARRITPILKEYYRGQDIDFTGWSSGRAG